MNLPRNGRVVVIDDLIEEGLPLVKLLSKNGVSTTYFTGLDKDELPTEPLADIRLVFLDMVIGTSQPDKNKLATVLNILKKIIGRQNSPYILIAWTKHKELIQEIQKFSEIAPPFITLDLEKSKCRNEDGGYDLEKIESKLEEILEEFGTFHLFVLWENIVHQSTNQIMKEFSSLYPADDKWSENLSNVFYQCAIAYAGKQLDKNDSKDIIHNGLLTFNRSFMDTLENSIQEFNPAGIKINFNPVKNLPVGVCARINSKLLLQESSGNNAIYPGNIYEIEKRSLFEIDIAELFNKEFDKYKDKDDLLNQVKHIMLEVSPSCDFAQDKWKRSRILHGVIWPEEYCQKIKKCEYIYVSPYLERNGSIFKIVFDLRYFTSRAFDNIRDKRASFRLKHDLLVDIQSQLARHINRPGVISLEAN